jgi:hypothetical protein
VRLKNTKASDALDARVFSRKVTSQNEDQMARTRKTPTSKSPVSAEEIVELTAAERELTDRFLRLVELLQLSASLVNTPEGEQAISTYHDFELLATESLPLLISVSDISNVVARNDLAATAVLTLLAERTALGLAFDPRDPTGQQVELPSKEVENFFTPYYETIESLDGLSTLARVEAVAQDAQSAAVFVGLYLAREGRMDIFEDFTWAPANLVTCLFAASVMTATLAQLAQDLSESERQQKGTDLFYISPASIVNLAEAAEIVLNLLDESDLAGLGNFGAASAVVEEILNSTDWLDELEVTDTHRLAAEVLPSFLEGEDGQEFERHDKSEFGLRLLAAAHTCGRLASDEMPINDREDGEEMSSALIMPDKKNWVH